ncbi:leucine-rich repeat domain-containing protein [Flavobacterium gilvum]|uniref:Uncharacterized protein n=1 Tax=Flavobacterium gilvum TaxID=1492737 RepID=A0AAC9I3S5_9FLAO|nr:leucine-rich repeat domain-containing protein [Flavobacterium gilvum]AOW09007.1 hypothetical protein EM308_05505 [Flavobacterium gilvum]KFC60550.1 hypothetical protein FEM08_05920 [Flavobacterium gilvum]
MKKIVFLLFYSSVFAQYTTIPDRNFERKLIEIGVDNVLDGKVQTDSISTLTVLNISGSNIKDLTGISDFKNLKKLICFNNQLTSLDISQNSQLTIVDCSTNKISILKATENRALVELDCSGNTISRLELFKNPNLEKLDCSGNKLIYLDLKSCRRLRDMNASYNLLRDVDLRNKNSGFTSDMGIVDLRINKKGVIVRMDWISGLTVMCDQDYVCLRN